MGNFPNKNIKTDPKRELTQKIFFDQQQQQQHQQKWLQKWLN